MPIAIAIVPTIPKPNHWKIWNLIQWGLEYSGDVNTEHIGILIFLKFVFTMVWFWNGQSYL